MKGYVDCWVAFSQGLWRPGSIDSRMEGLLGALPTTQELSGYVTRASSISSYPQRKASITILHRSPFSSCCTLRIQTPVKLQHQPFSPCIVLAGPHKDPQISLQWIWAFPTILCDPVPWSWPCPKCICQWFSQSFSHPFDQRLPSISKSKFLFAWQMVLEWQGKEITTMLPASPWDSWTPCLSSRGCCRQ